MDISPTFNMDAMYKEYTETEDMLTIMDTVRAGFEELPSLDRMGIDLSDYDSVKNNITMVIREKADVRTSSMMFRTSKRANLLDCLRWSS